MVYWVSYEAESPICFELQTGKSSLTFKKIRCILVVSFNIVKAYFNYIKESCKRGEKMASNEVPLWLSKLEDEDYKFIKKFLLASGSLKEIAKSYQVTYPTIRLRLDRLIKKIQLNESQSKDPYIELIKKLAIEEEISFETTKILINGYKQVQKDVD